MAGNYFYEKDFDLVKFDEEQKRQAKFEERDKQRKLLRIARRAGGDENAMDGIVTKGMRLRQTFAVPFHTQCLHCNQRIAKGVHVYMNRYVAQGEGEAKTELGLKVWEIQFRCTHCAKHIYIRTDNDTPEQTGGYIPWKHCKRFAGDFLDLYKKEAAKAAEDKIAAAKAMATMSDAERRGIENKARQEEQLKLEAMLKSKNAVTATDLLEQLESGALDSLGGGNTDYADPTAADADGLLPPIDGDDEGFEDIMGFYGSDDDEDARSVSDAGDGDENDDGNGNVGRVAAGNKRDREGDNVAAEQSTATKPPTASAAPATMPIAPPNDFLASLGAVLGTSFNLNVAPAVVAQPPPQSAAATEVPGTVPATAATPATTTTDASVPNLLGGVAAPKKKAAPKLKGKDLLNSYFN